MIWQSINTHQHCSVSYFSFPSTSTLQILQLSPLEMIVNLSSNARRFRLNFPFLTIWRIYLERIVEAVFLTLIGAGRIPGMGE